VVENWWARRGPVTLVAVWVLSVPVLALVAAALRARPDVRLLTGAEPFVGYWVVRTGPGIVLVLALLVGVVRWGPGLAARLPWRGLLPAAGASAVAWAVALATTTSWDDLTAPTRGRHEYLAVVPDVLAGPRAFLDAFLDPATVLPTHVAGHPPGLVLLLAALDRAGLGGAGWATALFVLAGASTVPAVLVTLRALGAAEATVRSLAPALVLAPAALWVATSADAFFAGVLGWGVALLALASAPGARRRWAYAAGAGLLLGACPLLSYGLLHMGLIALAPVILTRRAGPTLVAGLVAVGAVLAAGLSGFWLWDGIALTHEAWAPTGAARPYLYFAFVDLVVLGAIVGPAAFGGLARLGRTDAVVRTLVLLALAAAAVGVLLGFERGELERIWLPLAYWAVPAVAGLRRLSPSWLWAQGGVAVLLETILESPW